MADITPETAPPVWVEDRITIAEDLLDCAWGIIANVGNGNWSLQSDEWRQATLRWRDEWHAQFGSKMTTEQRSGNG